jgi:hypothetical protein
MGSPAWLTGIFAALMLTVATYCAGRLAVARRWQRPTEFDTDAGHVLMGVAMAGMLVARLRILPAVTWEAVFGAGAVWFAWQVLQSRRHAPATSWRCLHPGPHLVECAAMLYMFLVLPSLAGRGTAAGMAAMSAAGSSYSFLALVMALFMVGYVVRVADRLTIRAPALAAALAGPAPPAAPAAMAAPAPPDTTPPGGRVSTSRPYLAPRCAALCKIAMGLTMAYMLVLVL